MGDTFPERLKKVREDKKDEAGKKLSQEGAARIFHVSLSCWRSWEHIPPRHWPDARSRHLIELIWPEVFSRQP